jgi:hypothetical protein
MSDYDSQNLRKKEFISQLKQFYDSPFRGDRLFAIDYVVQLSRDNLLANEEIIEYVFFDEMFNMMINIENEEDINVDRAYAVFCNLIESRKQRDRITKQGYLKLVYDKIMPYVDYI